MKASKFNDFIVGGGDVLQVAIIDLNEILEDMKYNNTEIHTIVEWQSWDEVVDGQIVLVSEYVVKFTGDKQVIIRGDQGFELIGHKWIEKIKLSLTELQYNKL